MTVTIEDELEIRRSPDDVFAFVSDHEHLPVWQAGVRRVKRSTPLPIGPGASYVVTGRVLGREVDSSYELTAYEPTGVRGLNGVGGSFSGRLTSSLFQFEETYSFSGELGTTTVRMKGTASARGLLRLLGPLFGLAARKQIKADHRRLKTVLEKPASSPKTRKAAPTAG